MLHCNWLQPSRLSKLQSRLLDYSGDFVTDYARTSFWLETAGDDLTPRPPVTADESADVVILGGGFSGLWTAFFLLRQEPGLDVVVIEREICGYGASGRNGGWCSPRFPVDAHALIRRVGVQAARDTMLALEAMVEEVGRHCEEAGIDAEYRHTGLLSLARSPGELDTLKGALKTYQALGMGAGNKLLGAEETYGRVHATKIAGGLATKAGATVHPGKLVRGLARAVERMGGRIYEQSEVVALEDGAVRTDAARVTARKAVILAAEAYLSRLPGHRRTVLPMSSMIVLSEPLSDDTWREIGWSGGESLSSQVHTKNYLTKTSDGRLLYGSRGARYQFGSRLDERAIHDEEIFAWMRGCVADWWPVLEKVRFTHQWGGFLGVPRDWMPSVDFSPSLKLGHLYGYTGRGVTTSALSAKLLAGLVLGRRTGLEKLPLHRSGAPKWEPEPFRWLAIRYVQAAFSRIDEADREGRRPPLDARFAEKMGGQ